MRVCSTWKHYARTLLLCVFLAFHLFMVKMTVTTRSSDNIVIFLQPSLDSLVPAKNRLVSNLLFLGKAAEKAVAEHLDDATILYLSHSGFYPGCGTQTALVTITCVIRRHLDWDGFMLLWLLDLTAEFDMVSYDLTTHCLADVGIQGSGLQWLISYLCGWEKKVALGEKGSLQ